MNGSPTVSPGTFAGRYAIEREVGTGATARVYLALDLRHQRRVAIKILHPELAQSLAADRFLREIELTRRLNHPHILPLLESGEDDGQLYFVLPFMEEGTLRSRLQRDRQLPVDEALRITQTVAEALDYAHAQGVIHRDIKPENILITSGQAVLGDFGIARALEQALGLTSTSSGLVRGTPAYMSPEQASGATSYDGRSDIYSLGCVLYEMLAGMAAFMGPTPEAVIAQRFQHSPRDITVYRPTIPDAVAEVIRKALQLSPADRYATAGEFAQALREAQAAGTVPGRRAVRRPYRTHLLVAGGVLLATAAILAGTRLRQGDSVRAGAADTTRIAVLPVETPDGAAHDAHDLLSQAFARWQGISVVDRTTMLAAQGYQDPPRSDADARATALRLGAGRYVRARVSAVGGGERMWAALYDVGGDRPLAESRADLPSSAAARDSVVARLSDELLLRRTLVTAPSSLVLPAVQLFDGAMRALESGAWRTADTMLLASLEADPAYASAALWLAQVRNWKQEPSGNWLTWAERAAPEKLSERERSLRAALLAMGNADHPEACRIYEGLRSSDPRDFASWFGIGQCNRLDGRVVPDSRSPSGWRFRGSSHTAARAYARAFELAPALRQNFEARAYGQLRDMLYVDRSRVRPGVALAPDTTRFAGYAIWRGDSLVHLPYPREMMVRGAIPIEVAARSAAAVQQRQLFRRVTEAWVAALPNSPGAKEALAISLESDGDPAALAAISDARALAADSELRLRLAVTHAFMLVGFGRQAPENLEAGRRLADSVLRAVASPTQEQASTLAPLAVLLARCDDAARLAARGVPRRHAELLQTPLVALTAAESLSVRLAMGCDQVTPSAAVERILAGVLAAPTAGATRSSDQADYDLFGRTVVLAETPDLPRMERMERVSGDYLLRAHIAASRNDGLAVRRILQERQRLRVAQDLSPDAALAEGRAWLAIGDTSAAIATIDPVLDRTGWLELMINSPISVASLMRMGELRQALRRSRANR
jgi:tRNA A-37 threonylcarbamoyl transferase component Bud32